MQHDYVRHLLPAYALGELPEDQTQDIAAHLERCPICRDELAQMQRVLDITAGMVPQQIPDDMTSQSGQMVLETIEVQNLTPEKPPRRGNTRKIQWISAIAAMVLLIAPVLIWMSIQNASMPTKLVDKPTLEISSTLESKPDHVLSVQLAQAKEYLAQQNVTDLLDLLQQGEPQTQIQVADYLAQLQTKEAVPWLNRLAAVWQDDSSENPFTRAIKKILAVTTEPNEPLLPIVAAANEPNNVLVLDVPDDVNRPELTQVRVKRILRYADGSEIDGQIWLKKTNLLKDDGFSQTSRTIIDNGIERLEINWETQEAQRSDSYYPQISPFERLAWGYAELLREEAVHFECQKDEELSTSQQWVYDVYSSYDHTQKGVIWVDPETLLVQQWQSQDQRLTLIFNYEDIPEAMFVPECPESVTELTHRERVTISGQVLDRDGLPVSDALVQADCWLQAVGSLEDVVEVETDQEGRFQLVGPPVAASLDIPTMIWASQNKEIAWTILRSEERFDTDLLLNSIPGSAGTLIYDDADRVVKAMDILLVMEPSESLAGIVLDANDHPIAGAQVTTTIYLTDPNGETLPCGSPILVTTSTAGGEYRLQVPQLWPCCCFQISTQAPGYVTDTTVLEKQKQPILRQDIKLWSQGPTVRGTLLDNYGTLLGNRRVVARIGDKPCPGNYQTYTDVYGRFELEDCPSHPNLSIVAYTSQEGLSGSTETRVYYPDVILPIPQAMGRSDVQVELIAILPELELEVLVVDEQDTPLSGYPVSVEGNLYTISSFWREQAAFSQQTDDEGRCYFEGVPDIENLHLVLDPSPQYRGTEVPIKVVEGQTEYSLRVVVKKKE